MRKQDSNENIKNHQVNFFFFFQIIPYHHFLQNMLLLAIQRTRLKCKTAWLWLIDSYAYGYMVFYSLTLCVILTILVSLWKLRNWDMKSWLFGSQITWLLLIWRFLDSFFENPHFCAFLAPLCAENPPFGVFFA